MFGCRQVESKGSETAGREYSCQHIGRSRCRTEHRSSVPGQRRAARKAKTRGCPGQWEGGTRDGMAATDRTTNKHQTSPNRQYILTPCHRHVAIARRGGSGSVGAEHTSRPTRLVGWVRCGSPWRGCPQVNLQAAGATQTPSPLCDPAAFRVSPCTCRYGAERRWWRSRTAQPRLVFCVARPPSIWEYKRYEETQTRMPGIRLAKMLSSLGLSPAFHARCRCGVDSGDSGRQGGRTNPGYMPSNSQGGSWMELSEGGITSLGLSKTSMIHHLGHLVCCVVKTAVPPVPWAPDSRPKQTAV